MPRVCWLCLVPLGLLISASATRADLPPLIPRSILLGNPVKASPSVSPDGKYLAYLAPDQKNVLQVWVRTLGKNDDRPVTNDKKRGIRTHLWTYAPHTLLFLQDNEGDENSHVFSVHLTSKIIRDLTPFVGVRAQPIAMHHDFPNELLVTMNLENPRLYDVYRINLNTGACLLDTKNPGDVVSWEIDPKFKVRGAQAPTRAGGSELRIRADEKAPWKTLLTWGPEDADGHIIDFTADGQGLWLNTSENRNTLALVKYDLKTGKEQVLASTPNADAGSLIYDGIAHKVQAVSFDRGKPKWEILDPSIAEDMKFLEKECSGFPLVVSRDQARKVWVVACTQDVKPPRYYLYDRPGKKLTFLFTTQPALEKVALAPTKPVLIKARDGLELVCYLTLPVGIPHKNLPLVLTVHGGPWARDTWGFNPQTQWLANRGYAVLAVNYRGSTGFGKKFLHAGDREWAGKMHDDLLDAVTWTVKEGYVDARKVAIFGGSYGGYAALVGATFTPDFFRCAVDIVGPSNLVTLLRSIPPYWEPMKKQFALRVGDLDKEEEFLKSRSPLFKVDRIKIPLLIAQGANDPRVKQAESEQIVEALRKAGKPVEYLLFKDEGHGFVRPENRLKFYAAAEAFLAKHLGGRAEPAQEEKSAR